MKLIILYILMGMVICYDISAVALSILSVEGIAPFKRATVEMILGTCFGITLFIVPIGEEIYRIKKTIVINH